MMRKILYLGLCCNLLMACNPSAKKQVIGVLDVQGHRGCRGLMPENTTQAMLEAIRLGVKTLEMDVHISRDKQVFLSHNPYMSAEFMLKPDGSAIRPEQEKTWVLYQMPYATIKEFDVGSKAHPLFPTQKKFKTHMPLLSDVIAEAEAFTLKAHLPSLYYNIEIKSVPSGDGFLHPTVPEYVDLVVQILQEKNIVNRAIIQSFDVRALQYMHAKYPAIQTAYLIENKLSLAENIAKLGFIPTIYSPESILVEEALVAEAHCQGMLIIPWTVNQPAQMQQLIALGVDGLITDYPDRVANVRHTAKP